MQKFNTSQLSSYFDKHSETIRRWTKEFGDFLSHEAQSSSGRARVYNDDDLGVFILVNQMKDLGFKNEDIRLALENGERGDIPSDIPDDAMALTVQSSEWALQVEVLSKTIREKEDEIIQLKTKLEDRERELEKSEARAKELDEEKAKLHREIGNLEAQLAMYKEMAQKDDD